MKMLSLVVSLVLLLLAHGVSEAASTTTTTTPLINPTILINPTATINNPTTSINPTTSTTAISSTQALNTTQAQSLECDNDHMTFTLLKTDRYDDVKNVTFLDTSCKATKTPTGYVMTTKFGYCKTNFSIVTNHVIYYNYAIIIYGDSSSNIISRQKTETVELKCHMPRNLTFSKASPSFKVNMSITIATDSFGEVSLSLPMFKDNTFQDSYLETDFPVSQDPNEDMNLKLKFNSTVNGLKMVPQECFATTTADLNSPLKYYLIKDRCPKDDTLQYTLQDKEIQLTFEPFDFLVQNDGIFIHCGAVICSTTSTDAVCQFDDSCNKRRRRDVFSETEQTQLIDALERDRREATADHSESFYVATGYIKIKKEEANSQNTIQSKILGSTATNLLIAGVCILSLIAVLIIIKILLQRKKSTTNNNSGNNLNLEKVKC